MRLFINRLWRAARLDETLYREVGDDARLLRQAVFAVILSSVALGVGVSGNKEIGDLGAGILSALMSWLLWAILSFWIGTKIMPATGTRVNTGALLRALGFSSAPGILGLAGLFPYMSAFMFFVTTLWILAAMIAAIRAVFNYPGMLRALCVCLIGWVIHNGIRLLVFSLRNPAS